MCCRKQNRCNIYGAASVVESDLHLIVIWNGRRIQQRLVGESRWDDPFWFQAPHRQKRKIIYNVKNNHSCSVYDNRDEVSILQLQAKKPRLTKFLVHEYYIFYVSCDKR